MPNYVVIENLLNSIEIPQDGTLSRTIHRDDRVKIVLFGFAGGQELSQHTAAVPAVIEILRGDARVTLDGEEKELSAGSWVFMDAQLPHSIYARTDVIMLLTMLTGANPK
ncbi:MAG: cupin domain-containing protein [Candidatus Korobacteraceae bacterium]